MGHKPLRSKKTSLFHPSCAAPRHAFAWSKKSMSKIGAGPQGLVGCAESRWHWPVMVGFVDGKYRKNRWRNQGETMVSHSEKDLHMVDKQHIDISDYRRVYT